MRLNQNISLLLILCLGFSGNLFSQPLNTATAHRITNQWQGETKTLDVINDQVQLVKSNTYSGEGWKFVAYDKIYYLIVYVKSGTGQCLEVIKDSRNDRLKLSDLTNKSSQLWKATKLGKYYLFTNALVKDKSIEVVKDGVNNKVRLAKTSRLSNQMWLVKPLAGNEIVKNKNPKPVEEKKETKTNPAEGSPGDGRSEFLSVEETKLYNLLMEYRKANNLPAIPISPALNFVAQTHVKDLHLHRPNQKDCNMHSWSANGKWKGCCYPRDGMECMWEKPIELTKYKAYGFENSFWSSGRATADAAMKAWKSSPGHNATILNLGIWDEPWRAIGIGIYENYAVIWFGAEPDRSVNTGKK